MANAFRTLPSVDSVLSDERIKHLQEIYPRELLADLIRHQLERGRQRIASGDPTPTSGELVQAVLRELQALDRPSLRPVVNASGVILHTNLGRAALSREAIAAMEAVSRGYSNLEFDVETGTRGSRHGHIEPLLRQLTGAEAALVTNNNAAGILLALSALAKRKEVIVSRGEAVEIGGGFRIPDVMRQSGAKLIEVGTTNCTYATDYEAAITGHTAALMRVHPSNFRVVGYSRSITIAELVALADGHGLPVLDDQGSGCLLDTTRFGLVAEPVVQQSIAAGCGLVLFSGDKLLGGPQAGLIAGKKVLIDRLKKHPLMRAIRIDKIRLAGLAATLSHYLKGEAESKVPVWQMISTGLPDIERRARMWALAAKTRARVIDGVTEVGGGSLPGSTLPTRLLALRQGGKAQDLYRLLSLQDVPVIGRISGDTLLLDPRTVLPEEDDLVIRSLRQLPS